MDEAQHTPTERAMKAAVLMEVHAACSTMTVAKAAALDEQFPAYDDMLAALRMFQCIDFDLFTEHDEVLLESVIQDVAAAISKAQPA